jgi:hypothetical protein
MFSLEVNKWSGENSLEQFDEVFLRVSPAFMLKSKSHPRSASGQSVFIARNAEAIRATFYQQTLLIKEAALP